MPPYAVRGGDHAGHGPAIWELGIVPLGEECTALRADPEPEPVRKIEPALHIVRGRSDWGGEGGRGHRILSINQHATHRTTKRSEQAACAVGLMVGLTVGLVGRFGAESKMPAETVNKLSKYPSICLAWHSTYGEARPNWGCRSCRSPHPRHPPSLIHHPASARQPRPSKNSG